jgi:uncharacterized protein (TIGR02444 family)
MQTSREEDLPLEGPHWTFALEFYQRPDVSEACLLLQDTAGVDISLLLFVLFVAEKHCTRLDQPAFTALDQTIAPWREEVVRPLRSLRRRLKSGPVPGPSSTTEALRDRIKSAEIHAEQIELAVLAQWLDRHPPKAAPVDIVVLLDQLVTFFAGRVGRTSDVRSPELQAALDAIVRAMTKFSGT